jgi:hypothetical protein
MGALHVFSFQDAVKSGGLPGQDQNNSAPIGSGYIREYTRAASAFLKKPML